VIKTADWIIDLGPEGGPDGGTIVAEGPPEQVAAIAESHTGRFLRARLAGSRADGGTGRRRSAADGQPVRSSGVPWAARASSTRAGPRKTYAMPTAMTAPATGPTR